MHRTLAFVLLLSLLTACAPNHYSAFNKQQVWPTAKGAVPDTACVVPVYRGWPERPFRVLGSIPLEKNKNDRSRPDAARAARLAKNKGGDALIIASTGELGLAANSLAPRPAAVSVLVIKWKSQAETAAEKQAWARFQTRFKATHPGRELTDELLEMTVGYAARLGLNLDSPSDLASLEADLDNVAAAPGNARSSQWLFRGTFHVTAPAGSFAETVYGIATLTQTNGNVSLIANTTAAGLHFNGLAQDGRLSGTIDISAGPVNCKAKAGGSVVPNRISLDSRGETANEMIRGSFSFLR